MCVCLLASQFFVVDVCVLCMKQGGPICNIDSSFEDSSLRALINNTLFLSLSLSLSLSAHMEMRRALYLLNLD